jgi:mycothiol synthase
MSGNAQGVPQLEVLKLRPFDPASDYGPAAELISIAHRHDGIDWLPTPEVLQHEWGNEPAFRPESDAMVAEVNGSAIGLVAVDWRPRGDKVVHHIEIWVLPDRRRNGIGRRLLSWAEQRAGDLFRAGEAGSPDVPHELGGWGDADVPGHAQLAASAGYRVARYGFDMRRPVAGPIPDITLPAGLEVRPVVPADYRTIWSADVEAFQDHFEPHDRTENDFQRWFTAPWLDTSLWQVAWDGEEVAGSVLTSINEEENERLGVRRAWLDHISVRAPWRRRGLAGALIASTLKLVAERGVEEAALGVDAENPTGALRLYERMGFARHRTGISYRKAR